MDLWVNWGVLLDKHVGTLSQGLNRRNGIGVLHSSPWKNSLVFANPFSTRDMDTHTYKDCKKTASL